MKIFIEYHKFSRDSENYNPFSFIYNLIFLDNENTDLNAFIVYDENGKVLLRYYTGECIHDRLIENILAQKLGGKWRKITSDRNKEVWEKL
jgi:hypothetical protein